MRRLFGLTLCTLLGGTQVAHAATIKPTLNSGLCLDIAGGSDKNGTTVQIANCNGGNAQNWTVSGNTIRALGKCLDVRNGSTSNGTALQIADCNDGKNASQQFKISNGTLAFTKANKCVDISNGRATDGRAMQIWDCVSNVKAQQWQTSLSTGGSSSSNSSPSAGNTPSVPQGGRLMQFVNQCSDTVWVALQNNGNKAVPTPSGFPLSKGGSKSVALGAQWGGRMWGRTGCNVNGSSATCDTGDCGSKMECGGIGGQPSSLVEFLFDGWNGPNATQDFYDISLVDAFNLPVGIKPVGGSGVCHAPKCSTNILNICPADLQVKDKSGKVVNCLSSCTKYQTDDTCCRNAHNTLATCPAPEGAKVFKEACPDAYSYAYDDGTSTWNCTGPSGYVITFCP
jgi:hypothetical protein